MSISFDFKKEIYKDYPHCEICDAGGIASNDCPSCGHKILGWYQKKLDMLIDEKQQRLDCAKKALDDQIKRFQDSDYYD